MLRYAEPVETAADGNLRFRFSGGNSSTADRLAQWLPVAACVGLLVFQMTRTNALFGLSEYDDGPYLGSAIRLVHGAVPYRDFAFPHPPGMPILLAPLAALFRWSSTRTLMLGARLLTAGIAVVNVWLLARLLRHRGSVVAGAAALGLAVFPLAPLATKTVLIEPYLVLLCLIGCTLLFHGDSLVGGRRLFWAGVVFGLAATVKLWAAFPILAVLACCLPNWRERLRRVVPGLVAGFAVPVLPFLVAAPRDFIRQVLVVQLQRAPAWGSLSVGQRFVFIAGLRPYSGVSSGVRIAVTLVIALAVAALAAMWLRRPTSLDVFALLSSVLVVIGMLVSGDMFMHYAYFSAVFLAVLGALTLGTFVRLADDSRLVSGCASGAATFVALMGVLAMGVVGAVRTVSLLDREPGLISIGDYGGRTSSKIPAGSCVLADEPTVLLNADRFVADRRCLAMVDPYYEWLVRSPKYPPPSAVPAPASLVEFWRRGMEQADYVVFGPNAFRVPWTPELSAWFNQHFVLVDTWYASVYRRLD